MGTSTTRLPNPTAINNFASQPRTKSLHTLDIIATDSSSTHNRFISFNLFSLYKLQSHTRYRHQQTMRSSLIAVAASVATASAAIQGFNYGAAKTDGSFLFEADYKEKFSAAKNLPGASGFSSARLYTMIVSTRQHGHNPPEEGFRLAECHLSHPICLCFLSPAPFHTTSASCSTSSSFVTTLRSDADNFIARW
jgi:hypothetical protein